MLLKAGVEGGFDCLQEGNKEAEYLKHEIKHGGKGGRGSGSNVSQLLVLRTAKEEKERKRR